MCEVTIRRAKFKDIPQLDKLLFEVHKIHSDIRPDLFTVGEKKYTDEELERIIVDEQKPIFVAEHNGKVKGYAFCIFKQDLESKSVTNIKTLYIDDLCVDEDTRGMHIGTKLYNHVIDFEYNGHSFVGVEDNYDIGKTDLRIWLKYDDWYIKV